MRHIDKLVVQYSQAHTTKRLAYDVLRQVLDGRDAQHRRQRDERGDVREGGYGGEGLLERNTSKLSKLMSGNSLSISETIKNTGKEEHILITNQN